MSYLIMCIQLTVHSHATLDVHNHSFKGILTTLQVPIVTVPVPHYSRSSLLHLCHDHFFKGIIHNYLPLSAHSAGTKTYHRRDNAPDPLFSWVDEAVLRRPTYHTFIKLLDNYEAGTGQAEVVTREEEQENWAFINACMTTKVCALHVYC